MKIIVIRALAVWLVMSCAAPLLRAERQEDYQAIKKAVKENPDYEAGREIRFFKILVVDTKTNKHIVRVTLPIPVVDAFLRAAKNTHVRMDRADCEIDVKELFAELKKAGPGSIIEIYEKDETVKVWFE